jgi:peptidoglycan/LPS O-acetylase OafA/YrhL
MNDIDAQIKQALSEEERQLIDDSTNQAGLFELLGMSFKGKQAWMMWYMWIAGIGVFALGLYFLSLFFAADDIKTSLAWALAIVACMAAMIVIKTISWIQMSKLEVIREIKRLELRLLSEK